MDSEDEISFVIECNEDPIAKPEVPEDAARARQKLLDQCVGTPRPASAIANFRQMCDFRQGPLDKLVHVKTHLGGVYWIEFSDQVSKDAFLKSGALDSLTVVPKTNPMSCAKAPPNIFLLQHHPKKPLAIGVPRFWGLSHFGLPQNDNRVDGLSVKVPSFGGTLRTLQVECNDQAMSMLKIWGGCTLLADCGFGKTATAIELAIRTQKRTLILCNREVLMNQWIDSIRQFVPECGPIGWIQGSAFDKGPPQTVRPTEASFQECFFSLGSIVSFSEAGYSRDLLSSFGTVIFDEMHHIAAQSLVHVSPMFAARNIVGLTATPDRSDGLEQVLQWLSGPAAFIQQRLPSITGITGSVEVEAVHFSRGLQKEVVQRNGNLGQAQMMTHLTKDPTRNDVLEELIREALSDREKVMVVTSHVDHAKGLFDRNLHAKQAIMAGSHQMPVEAKDPKTRLVFATQSLLEEGFDDPRLDALVLAMPRSKVQQTVGRVERSHPGKLVPKVQDLIDQFSLLPAMGSKRFHFYKSRGFTQTKRFL